MSAQILQFPARWIRRMPSELEETTEVCLQIRAENPGCPEAQVWAEIRDLEARYAFETHRKHPRPMCSDPLLDDWRARVRAEHPELDAAYVERQAIFCADIERIKLRQDIAQLPRREW